MPTMTEHYATVRDNVARLAGEGLNNVEIGARLGMSETSVRRYRKGRIRGVSQSQSNTIQDSAYEGDGNAFRESGDGTAVASVLTGEIVRTMDDAVRVAGVDTKVWYVDRFETTAWTVGMKVKDGDGERAVKEQQYRVKLYLRRILPRAVGAALDAIYDRIAKHAPAYPKLPKVKAADGEPYLCVIGLFDAHFGKLCWGDETGSDYDLKTAEAVYRNGVDDLLAEAANRPVGQWLLPIGNDFFHIDNSRNTTYAGTSQDVDGRYAKVIEAGEMAVVNAVERLMTLAPVNVVWVPGNHDPTTSFHLARTVSAWFRRADRVTVDASPSPRKYVTYGKTLLGLTHGNEEKTDHLPNIMATERPAEWSNATCREWLLGHMHRSRQWVTKPIDTHTGTTIRVLRSVAGTDAWHHRKGYVGTAPSAEAYFYGRDRGYAGHAVVPVRAK